MLIGIVCMCVCVCVLHTNFSLKNIIVIVQIYLVTFEKMLVKKLKTLSVRF